MTGATDSVGTFHLWKKDSGGTLPTSRTQSLVMTWKEESKKGIRALRGGCGGAAAARRPRRLLAVAMDGEAAAEEEEERGRERASAVGAGEGRGAQQRRTLWFVVIAGVFNLY